MAGFELPNNSVRVEQVTRMDQFTAEATAQIETAFRFEQDDDKWQVREFRVGPDRWESVDVLVKALGQNFQSASCNANSSELSPRRARCVIAELAGIETPFEAVRIRGISSLSVPMASHPSAVVVALIKLNFRFTREGRGWRISEVRTGTRGWADLSIIVAAVDEIKRELAQEELRQLASALEAFREERGFYVTADDHGVLVDHLSPSYIAEVVRLDPWHRPYRYQGSSDRFVLRSMGPDGQENTADDVVVSGSW